MGGLQQTKREPELEQEPATQEDLKLQQEPGQPKTGEASVDDRQCKPYGPFDSICDCPRRTMTPEPPTPPFTPTADNLPKLKQFLLDY